MSNNVQVHFLNKHRINKSVELTGILKHCVLSFYEILILVIDVTSWLSQPTTLQECT